MFLSHDINPYISPLEFYSFIQLKYQSISQRVDVI
jgi:hypothetical protein